MERIEHKTSLTLSQWDKEKATLSRSLVASWVRKRRQKVPSNRKRKWKTWERWMKAISLASPSKQNASLRTPRNVLFTRRTARACKSLYTLTGPSFRCLSNTGIFLLTFRQVNCKVWLTSSSPLCVHPFLTAGVFVCLCVEVARRLWSPGNKHAKWKRSVWRTCSSSSFLSFLSSRSLNIGDQFFLKEASSENVFAFLLFCAPQMTAICCLCLPALLSSNQVKTTFPKIHPPLC